MNYELKREINSCISELDSIVRELREISDCVKKSISGLNTTTYTRTIESSAARYENAARKLRSIK